MKYTNKKASIESIEHPYRFLASLIIDNIIEPKFNRGHCIKGERYYNLEDDITNIINSSLKQVK